MPANLDQLPENPHTNKSSGTKSSSGEGARTAELSAAVPPIKSLPSVRWYGVYPALVRDIKDPENMGRIKVLLTWAPDSAGMVGIEKGQQYEGWARLTTLMAGQSRGTWFIPDVDDEVLVAFEGGHPGRPVVVGSLWNGVDMPPIVMDDQQENNTKLIKTRSGCEIRINDKPNEETVQIQTAHGQKITLTDYSGGSVRIQDDNGNNIELKSSGITLSSSARMKVSVSTLEIDASLLEVQSAMAKFDGVVQCETLVAKSVVSDAYTPGAGNVW